MELLVHTSIIGGLSVLDVTGEIDLATLPQLHNAIIRAFSGAGGADLVVDLDGVYACDDAALGVLLGAAGRARGAGGDLRVVCSDGTLRTRLARTGFDRAVVVVGSIAALHANTTGADTVANGAAEADLATTADQTADQPDG